MPAQQTQATVTDWGQQRINPKSAQALSSLPNPLSLDLLQIFGEGGDVLVTVSHLGVVSLNPVSHTTQCLFGRYYSRLKSTATIAQIFADVFSENKSQQDIMQVRGQGENRIWHLDASGVAYNS